MQFFARWRLVSSCFFCFKKVKKKFRNRFVGGEKYDIIYQKQGGNSYV